LGACPLLISSKNCGFSNSILWLQALLAWSKDDKSFSSPWYTGVKIGDRNSCQTRGNSTGIMEYAYLTWPRSIEIIHIRHLQRFCARISASRADMETLDVIRQNTGDRHWENRECHSCPSWSVHRWKMALQSFEPLRILWYSISFQIQSVLLISPVDRYCACRVLQARTSFIELVGPSLRSF
jgi:hypothetical protein